MRLLCFLLGHALGSVFVFTYTRQPHAVSQYPNRRGPTEIKVIGQECKRCRRVIR